MVDLLESQYRLLQQHVDDLNRKFQLKIVGSLADGAKQCYWNNYASILKHLL